MAKLTAWIFTVIGALLVLQLLIPATFNGAWFSWTIAVLVLVMGIAKLMRNYSHKKR